MSLPPGFVRFERARHRLPPRPAMHITPHGLLTLSPQAVDLLGHGPSVLFAYDFAQRMIGLALWSQGVDARPYRLRREPTGVARVNARPFLAEMVGWLPAQPVTLDAELVDGFLAARLPEREAAGS